MSLHRFFFYCTLILLPTQLGFHWWPDWSFVIGRRIDYLSPTLFLTDITILLTLIFWYKTLWTQKKILLTKKNFISSWHLVAIIFFITLNISFSFSPFVSLYKWIKILEFFLFGVYIVKTQPSLSRAIWCLSFAIFYSSLIGICQNMLQHSVGGFLWILGEREFTITTPGIAKIQIAPLTIFGANFFLSYPREILRAYATFPHPNVLGGFLAITIPLLSFYKQKNIWKQLFYWATAIIGVIALILTFSRSAWIIGLVNFITVFLIKNKKQKIKHLSIAVAVLCIGLFLFALPYFQMLTPESESIFVRNTLNFSALSIWWSSTITRFFGAGLGNYLVTLPYFYSYRSVFFIQPVHNIYLLLLAETGIIGVLFFLYKLIPFLFYNIQKISQRKKNNISSVFFISLCLILAVGLVDHYPLTLQQGQLLITLFLSFVLL